VRTMRTPHSSSATLPSTLRTVSTPCMIAEPYASIFIDESFLTVLLRAGQLHSCATCGVSS
jgi:hypothetical protein